MKPFYCFSIKRHFSYPLDRRRQVGRAQRGEDRLDPLRALGMAQPGIVEAARAVPYDGGRHLVVEMLAV